MTSNRQTLGAMLLDLWRGLEPRRRTQFWFLIGLMVIASLSEATSIGAVLPFLAVLTNPERAFNHQLAQPFIHVLGIQSPRELLLPFAIGFCLAAVVSGGIRLLLLFATTRYTFSVGADLSVEAYRRTLYQSYSVHVRRNSSEVISGIIGKTAMMVGSVLVPSMNLIGSSLLLIGVSFVLLAMDPIIAIAAGGTFALLYFLVARVTRTRLRANSEIVARNSTLAIKSLQEGLGGIRDVLIGGSQEVYIEGYRTADRRQRVAQGNTAFLAGAPRFVIETLGMVLIAAAAYAVAGREGGVVGALPMLGALALGAQRLLPILQQAYLSLTIIRGGEQSLRDALGLLRQPLHEFRKPSGFLSPMEFSRDIRIVDLSFRYDAEAVNVLNRIDLVIPRGSRVGFIGPTGCGKSTFLDIVMGLLLPTEGHMEIDGIPLTAANLASWQVHLAHVPQMIYLSDGSVAENIAFGIPRELIDMERVRSAARQAQIAEFFEDLPQGYGTVVGERGVRLSGGQRQRIGIARALYKEADVIVFDEATSALDHETEGAVMEAIGGLGKDLTVLIVAHRLSTLKDCDFIVELKHGCLNRMGTFQEIIATI